MVHLTSRVPRTVAADGRIQFALTARAAADTVRSLSSLPEVRAVVAGAIQRRKCTVQQLVDELHEGPIRGAAQLRAVLTEVIDGVRSSPETDLRTLVARAGLPWPQFNVRLYQGRP